MECSRSNNKHHRGGNTLHCRHHILLCNTEEIFKPSPRKWNQGNHEVDHHPDPVLLHLYPPDLHTGVDPPDCWPPQTGDRCDHLLLVLACLHDRCLCVRPILAQVQRSCLVHDQRHLLSHQKPTREEYNQTEIRIRDRNSTKDRA